MRDIASKLHISTIDDSANTFAAAHGLGIEIAEFCWAKHLDEDTEAHIEAARRMARGAKSLWFHAPFAELSPCAIDPRALALAEKRYAQSVETAALLGAKRIVIHAGYIPYVYFPEHFVSESIRFWKRFLSSAPPDIEIALENVMEPGPEMPVEIVEGVCDARLGLCLDVGHANTVVSKTPPLDWIAPMAKHLKHVHLHNNHGGNDLHLPLGEGTVDFEAVIDNVLSLAPGATFTIENMHCSDSIKWLIEKGFLNDRR